MRKVPMRKECQNNLALNHQRMFGVAALHTAEPPKRNVRGFVLANELF